MCVRTHKFDAMARMQHSTHIALLLLNSSTKACCWVKHPKAQDCVSSTTL